MQYTIQSSCATATIDTLGAELIHFVVDGKERIWQNPTGEWAGHAPLLFPVCGRCGVKVNGVDYPVQLHGVARQSEFVLVSKGDNFLTLRLCDDEETRKAYPFAFVFDVTYALEEKSLSITFDVKNPADTPLYFGCGSHEAYALDGNVDEYSILFEKKERLLHHPHNNVGKLTGEVVDYGERQTLDLPRDVLQDGATLIFKDIQSRKVWLTKRNGEKVAEITFEGFGNLLFWRALDAEYICIEPWTNLPDRADVEDVEFSTKPGLIKLDAKASKRFVRTITF